MIGQLISHDVDFVLYNSMKYWSDIFLLCFNNNNNNISLVPVVNVWQWDI